MCYWGLSGEQERNLPETFQGTGGDKTKEAVTEGEQETFIARLLLWLIICNCPQRCARAGVPASGRHRQIFVLHFAYEFGSDWVRAPLPPASPSSDERKCLCHAYIWRSCTLVLFFDVHVVYSVGQFWTHRSAVKGVSRCVRKACWTSFGGIGARLKALAVAR